MDAEQLCVLFPWLADASNCLGGAHLLGAPKPALPALPPTSLSPCTHRTHRTHRKLPISTAP
jgi:hypothetical protein